ncbi:MAG: glycosyltransferase family 4 protein [Bryobacteraceae bacterium]
MCLKLETGGTERQLIAMARGLDRTRFQVHVGCFRSQGPWGRELREAGIELAEFPLRSVRSVGALGVLRGLGVYLRERRIRLLHTFDPPSTLLAVPVGRWFGTPFVISSQRGFRDAPGCESRGLVRLTDQMVDAIVVNSRAVRDDLISRDRVPASRLKLCYNGIDTTVFHARERVANERPRIGTVAMLRPEKGLHTLVDAFAQLPRGAAELVVVGEGAERAALEARTVARGVAGECRFTGLTQDVAGELRRIDIFVLPSLSEALSNSLLEAMACGCAAVASNAGGNPEVVEDGRTGLLFPAGDASALADRLRRLLGDPAMRTMLTGRGQARVAEQFGIDRAVRCFEDLYTSLMR